MASGIAAGSALLGLAGCADPQPAASSEGHDGAKASDRPAEPDSPASTSSQATDAPQPAADAETPSEAGAAAAQAFSPALATVEFDYLPSSTHASNQMAVWAEDAEGALVKTVFVTDFASRRRGYREREDAVSQWVSKADPESMGDDEIDAVSSATPAGGRLSYGWDFTDEAGNRVPDGTYRLVLEGTLFWGSSVRYEAILDMADLRPGPVAVEEIRSQPDEPTNEGMLGGVAVTVS